MFESALAHKLKSDSYSARAFTVSPASALSDDERRALIAILRTL